MTQTEVKFDKLPQSPKSEKDIAVLTEKIRHIEEIAKKALWVTIVNFLGVFATLIIILINAVISNQ